jgi:ankyrin repeat protein
MARWFESVEGSNSSSLEALIADHAKKQQDQFAYLYGNPLSEKDDLDEVINSPPYYEKLPCLQNQKLKKTQNTNLKFHLLTLPKQVTPIFLAILKRNVEAVKLLLDAGSDVNMRCHGHSLLHATLHLGGFVGSKAVCAQLVPLILSMNPDLTLKDDRSETALHVACSLGLTHEINLILEHASAVAASSATPEDGTATQKAVDVPALLDMKDRLGQRPLHHACIRNELETVKYLVENRSANMNVASMLGETPLHLACANESWEVVEYLRASGANENAPNKRALTPRAMIDASSRNVSKSDKKSTLIVTHPLCLDHHTCVAPITRFAKELPPPENVIRLQVLVDKEVGALRSDFIGSKTEW